MTINGSQKCFDLIEIYRLYRKMPIKRSQKWFVLIKMYRLYRKMTINGSQKCFVVIKMYRLYWKNDHIWIPKMFCPNKDIQIIQKYDHKWIPKMFCPDKNVLKFFYLATAWLFSWQCLFWIPATDMLSLENKNERDSGGKKCEISILTLNMKANFFKKNSKKIYLDFWFQKLP